MTLERQLSMGLCAVWSAGMVAALHWRRPRLAAFFAWSAGEQWQRAWRRA